MDKYPFQPELLDALPERVAALFRELEDTLLEDICSQLATGKMNEVTVQGIRALRGIGIDLEEIERAIQETASISETTLNDLLDDVVSRNQSYYSDLIDFAGLTQPEHIVGSEDINAIVAQTKNELANITQSMGFLVDNGRTKLGPAEAYQWALDNAEMQIQSGAISYNQAINSAVRQLADSGLKTVKYESGHIDQLDVAARRAALTGIHQVCAKYTEQSAAYLDSPYYEVSAHAGARDKPGASPWASHKDWQGKVYSVRAGDIYPNIYAVCGLGYVDGLEGANCRHIRNVWVEGVSERTYTDEQLANIDKPPFKYEGRTYTTYEATQKQREIERTIRKLKRERDAYKAAGLDEEAQTVSIRINRLSKEYTEFSKAAGLREQRERMQVEYTESMTDEQMEALKAKKRAQAAVKEEIKSGKYNLTINSEKQARHMVGSAVPGRSVFTISMEELQQIITSMAGTGEIQLTENLQWKHTEKIAIGREIGYTINNNGVIRKAYKLTIHYSKTGTHAVPSGW
ncbi:MAG: polymorphic toxin type 50 domain-containing protein [Firmicutes bacterium]|nr:polymorphic toxin type 50 domain-containing protein [Bacillota bacterium]